MFGKLKKFIFGDNREINRTFESDVIGRLVFSDDQEFWISEKLDKCNGVKFIVSGDWSAEKVIIEPSRELINTAESIARNYPSFERSVELFLASEITREPSLLSFRQEIETLKVSSICLFWPERPRDGEILFSSNIDSNRRLWACALADGAPTSSLSFSG